MKVIINADDFGFDADTVQATIDAIREGAVTSATLMARMPGSAAAIAWARHAPEVSFGVHLVFAAATQERPVLEPAQVATLTDARTGRFLRPVQVRWRALCGLLDPEQIVREASAQVAAVVDGGLRPTHLDSHFHLHKLRPFRDALRPVMHRFGIRRLRTAQALPIGIAPWRPARWTGRTLARRLAACGRTTDHFVMLDDGVPSQWWLGHRRLLGGAGTLEFGCHPGRAQAWRRVELEEALRFARWCDAHGIERIGWSAIGD